MAEPTPPGASDLSGESIPRPMFTGLSVYHNPRYQYSFLYPANWSCSEFVGEAAEGVAVSPIPGDLTNAVVIEASDLGETVGADDLPDIADGFRQGLEALPDSEIAQFDTCTTDEIVGVEAWQTYPEDSAVRRRWVRLVYWRTLQIRVIAQASSPTEFGYWLPVFFGAMRTLRMGEPWSQERVREWQATALVTAAQPEAPQ